MKNKRLLNIIGEIDDRYIIEASPALKKKNKPFWQKVAAVAAVFAVVLLIGFLVSDNDSLPMLSIGEFQEDTMGFEGFFAHNIDELKSNNPWNRDNKLKVLPVYNNTLYEYTEDWIVTEPDIEKMKDLLTDIANSLGMSISNIDIIEKDIDGYDAVDCCYVEDENYSIEVNAWLNVNISIKNKNILPQGYSVSCYASYEELYKTAVYLQEKFKNLLNMKNPVIDISLGDYDVYGNRHWNMSFYDDSDNMTESILNYNFNRIYFYGDDEGNLLQISFSYVDLNNKVGEYPIINTDEAFKLLDKGEYVTSVTHEFPGIDAVKKVELIYRTSTRDKFFMPYYKFYVQLNFSNVSSEDMGLNCFGTYYVPAVESKYIENMPLWDGSIN